MVRVREWYVSSTLRGTNLESSSRDRVKILEERFEVSSESMLDCFSFPKLLIF